MLPVIASNPWAQRGESRRAVLGRWGKPTFQAQELGGERRACHLNVKWLIYIVT